MNQNPSKSITRYLRVAFSFLQFPINLKHAGNGGASRFWFLQAITESPKIGRKEQTLSSCQTKAEIGTQFRIAGFLGLQTELVVPAKLLYKDQAT